MVKPQAFFLFACLSLLLLFALTPLALADNTLPLAARREWTRGVVIVFYEGAYGTGWWINPTHVVTAAHVVDNNPDAVVWVIRGDAESRGRVVALDVEHDIAIIRVERPDVFRDKYVFRLAARVPDVGDPIYVIGYPFELLQLMGSLRELSEHPRIAVGTLTWSAGGLIELGAIVDQGNSGGPVLDESGNVIGLVSFALTGRAGTLYFATTVDHVRVLCNQHGIAYQVGLSRPIDLENPAIAGALAGATASIVTDILILGAGIAIGGAIATKRR